MKMVDVVFTFMKRKFWMSFKKKRKLLQNNKLHKENKYFETSQTKVLRKTWTSFKKKRRNYYKIQIAKEI